MRKSSLIVSMLAALAIVAGARTRSAAAPHAANSVTADAPAGVALVCESLGAPAAYATAALPRAAATGDFNEDGITDLAVAGGNAVSILLGQGAAGVGDGTYAAPATITAGTSLVHIVASDFNDDGIIDLAATNSSGVNVLLGNGSAGVGNGTFGAPATFLAGSNPQRLAVADFNEDGIADIAVSNGTSNTVSILMGQGANGAGDGTFAAAVNYATGIAPGHLVVGDFNEDGIWDLAASNNSFTSNSISVLIGQGAGGVGDGTFAGAVNYPTGGSNPTGMASGDWNEDGRTDLAVVNGNSATISIFLGNGIGALGDGTFAAATTVASSAGGRDIETADFNGDGRADLAVANVTTDKVHVFLGGGAGTTGDGTFALASTDSVGQDPRSIALGDFNEDGAADVATAKTLGSTTAVLLGGCAPVLDTSILAFASGGAVVPVGTQQFINWTRGAAVMAVNVELSRDGGANWEMLASNVTAFGYAWTVTPPATEAARIRVSDAAVPTRFDEIDADFAICAPFGAAAAIPVGAGPNDAAVGDFNEDGIPDLAVACQSLGSVQILLGNGSRGVGNGTYAPPIDYAIEVAPANIIAGDWNDDGITDLAFTKPGTNTIEFLIGAGAGGVGNGSFTFDPICPPVAPEPGALLARDFNEDGILDIAVGSANGGDGIIAILIGIGGGGMGDGTFAPPVNFGIDADPSDIVAADFNEDGILDLASISDGTSNIMILTGQGANGVGNGNFTFDPICPPVAPFGRGLVTGDFNGDGITDLAATSPSMSELVIIRGNGAGGVGDGTFNIIEPTTIPIATTPFTLQKGDFNIDGITDLAVAGIGGGGGGQAEILYGGGSEGAGNGSFTCQMKFAIGAGATRILAGDFLEDNTIDLFVLCSGNATIAPLIGGCQDPDFAAISVTSPNGGEILPIGSAHTVSWSTSEEIDAVNVEISRDGGNNWETIAHNTTESSASWTVTPPVSVNALVRVSDSALPNRADMSNALFWIATPVDVGDPEDGENGAGAAPSASALSAAFPNPSAGEVRFALALPHAARATFDVYDASGRLVRRLAAGAFAAGEHALAWDGRAADGTRPSDGVYFLRAQWPGFEAVRKIVRVGADR
ncbi:MAG: FG-GAP-like repeat-containing protein [bacterium]